MITLKDLRINNSKNKTFIRFDDSISFNDDSINFIIGLSGVGKTSLINFLTTPFTDDPINNGKIILSDDIAIKKMFSSKKVNELQINNSINSYAGQYIKFIKKSVAFIPQKTDSFHPSIPVVKQMYHFYSMALPKGIKSDFNKFSKLLSELSPYAGWDRVSVNPIDSNCLILEDKKEYIDEETGEKYTIINKKSEKTYESQFSTGQLQRLLILMGLIQFHISDHPILIGDEFLVNFTYLEANEVLKNIIEYFMKEQKKHKLAIFILHDLSFDFLKSFNNNYPVNIIGIEQDNEYNKKINIRTETSDCQRIIAYNISLNDFFNKNWENNSGKYFFSKFYNSYESNGLTKNDCELEIKTSDDKYQYEIDIKENDYHINEKKYKEKLFSGDIKLSLVKNRFVILTGFSGCGKSTLCKLFIENNITDKSTFRYFPDRALSSISEDSQVSIKDDLQIMYNYYNGINDLEKYKNDIKKMIEKAHFYEDKDIISDIDYEEFLNKKIFDLSGGQQQRYWLIRLLLSISDKKDDYNQPELFIFDESIASLDCITKNKIIAFLLKEILSKNNAVILFISHDLRDVNVIYQTLYENYGDKNIEKLFEHYEMLDGNLYKVEEKFNEYKNNIINKRANRYYSLRDNKRVTLRLNGEKI